MKKAIWILAAAWLPSPAPAGDALGLEIGSVLMNLGTTGGAFGTFDLDTTSKIVGFAFQCQEPMTINALGFRYNLRTGTPPTYRFSLQGVNGSGNPDGTVKGGGTPASVNFTPPDSTAWNGTTQAIPLDNPYTCTRGEVLAAVIDYASGTIDSSNKGSFTTGWPHPSNTRQGFPTAQSFNGTTWTKSSEMPLFFYTSTDNKTYGAPVRAVLATAISTGSEQAMFFSLPTDSVATYKVSGVRVVLTSAAAAKTFRVVLYSGATVLQSVTIDSDYFAALSSSVRLGYFWFSDSTLATLTAGVTYRIGISPQQTANNVALQGLSLHDSQALTAFPGGASWGYSTRASCGAPCDTTATAWTDDSTVRPLMSLILADMTAPASTPSPTSHVFVK